MVALIFTKLHQTWVVVLNVTVEFTWSHTVHRSHTVAVEQHLDQTMKTQTLNKHDPTSSMLCLPQAVSSLPEATKIHRIAEVCKPDVTFWFILSHAASLLKFCSAP